MRHDVVVRVPQQLTRTDVGPHAGLPGWHLGYPPAIIYTRDRNRYLRSLRRADSGDPGPLGELVARSVTDNLYRFVVPAVAGARRLVPIVALATRTQSVLTLRAAIERGRLKAQKGADGQWRSTRAWVESTSRASTAVSGDNGTQ